MGGWAGTFEASEARRFAAWAETLACRLYPHRATLVTVGLAAFLVAVLPLASVAQGRAALASWNVVAFAASVPVVLWALCLAIHASFFEPSRGLVASFGRARVTPPRWAMRLLRAYATLTVAGFAHAPLFVLLAAASA
jgi:hypothetical protein